jgi:hypothetical protein
VGVDADVTCPRDRFRYRDGLFLASPFPRPIPGVPPERNLHGVSFAVANMTGLLARILESCSRDDLWKTLEGCAESIE